MVKIMPMVSMRHTPAEIAEEYFPTVADQPAYPYGLCLSLGDDELEKLDIDFDDICVGDLVHLHALAMITSKSCSEREGSDPCMRVEIQITHLEVENEETENEDDEAEEDSGMSYSKATRKLYKD